MSLSADRQGGMAERILALDVGERRIGMAVSDPLGLTAQPLPTYTRQNTRADLHHLQRVIHAQAAGRVVVGLPVSLRGETGPQAQRVLTWVDRLRRAVSVPIETMDERLTSRAADQTMLAHDVPRRRRAAASDQVAAQLILMQYLETHRSIA